MGNPGRLRYASSLAAALLLTGCDQYATRDRLEIDRNEMRARSNANERKIADLELRLKALEDEQASQARFIGRALETTSAVAKQVSDNAKIANENALKDMTRRGACGTEYVPVGNGGFTLANRKCTLKDMGQGGR